MRAPKSVRPSLICSLVGVFLLLAFVQTGFLLYLCSETIQAEREAARQHAVLMAAAELSTLGNLLRRHREIVDVWRSRAGSVKAMMAHSQSRAAVNEQMILLKRLWREDMNPEAINRISQITEHMMLKTTDVFSPVLDSEQRLSAYDEYIRATTEAFRLASARLTRIYASIDQSPEDKWPLIVAMLCSNVTVGFILVWLLNKHLVVPIHRLARNCQLIARGEPMPPAVSTNLEIALLETAFHRMSLQIADSEKGRRSYLELLQTAQMTSLELVGNLIRSMRDWPQAKQLQQTMQVNVGNMFQLVKSLSDLMGQQDSDNFELNRSTTNTTTLFRNALSALDVSSKKRGISVELVDPKCELNVDARLIERVLINLLSNAFKFSAAGSVVKVEGLVSENSLRILVRDEGPGISKQDQNKLFRSFSQVSPSKGDSSGLGLFICKQFVERHGGQLGCESEVGKGATFWFELPLTGKTAVVNPAASVTVKSRTRQANPWEWVHHFSLTRGSIKTVLTASLAAVLITQSVLALYLYDQLQQLAKAAARYASQKQTVINTQLLLANFLNWRQEAFEAIRDEDLNRFISVYPLLKQMSRLARGIAAETKTGPMHDVMVVVADQVDDVRRLAIQGLRNLSGLSREELRQAYSQQDDRGANVEEQLFAALKLENGNLNLSYDLGDKLQSNLLVTIVVTSVTNLTILGLLLAFGLHIVRQISLLNEKVERLASDVDGAGTLNGNEELDYLDARLSEAARQIEAARARRQHLMAVINHDLRSPLTSLLGALEILSEEIHGELEDWQFRTVSQIENAVLSLLDQINNLLMIEKIDAGMLEVQLESIALRDIVGIACEKARRRWKEKQVKLALDATNLHGDDKIRGDSHLCEWICGAALDNALAAAPPGSQVDVSVTDEDKGIAVYIQDQGPGIPESILTQVFQRFRFVDGMPITGLGLPLIYRLCTLQGAQVTVERRSSLGTSIKTLFLRDSATFERKVV